MEKSNEVKSLVDLGAYVRVELAGPLPLVAHLSRAACDQLGISVNAEVFASVRRDFVHVLPG